MAESIIDRGVIEIVGDARKLRASVEEAKKSLRTLGEGQKDISRAASANIDRYIGKLQAQNTQVGKSARQQELFNLSMRGASNEQLNLANAALKVTEANERQAAALQKSAGIDKMIASLKQSNVEFGKSTSEVELYRLALAGASKEQLAVAAAELKLAESLKRGNAEKERAQKARQEVITKAAGIDTQVAALRQEAIEFGKSRREIELHKLALAGATSAQLKAADSALKLIESQERMAKVAATLRTAFFTLGAAAAAAFTFKVSANIDFLDNINKLSKSTGLATEDLIGLNLVAGKTGTTVDNLAGALNKMTVEMGKDSKAFKELGITATDPMEAFGQLADLFNLLPSLQQKNTLANKVFGKSWSEVAGTLQEGSKRLREGVEEGKKLAGVTDENVKQADEFKSAVAELNQQSIALGATLIPILTEIVKLLREGSAILAKGFGGGGFLGLRGAIAGPKNDQEELARLNTAIAKTRETRDSFQKSSKGSLFGRLFHADDLAASNAQLTRLTTQRDALERKLTFSTEGVATLGSHSTPEQDAAAQKALAAAQAAASGRVTKFLDEGKKGPTDDAAARARALAREQLEFDISEIRKGGELRVDAFQNAERIMQASRSASLIDDKDYFESKRAFIQLIAREEEASTRAEVQRLQQETALLQSARAAAIKSGDKDKIGEADRDLIDNARKIAEAQAKILKIQADATVATVINAKEQEGAVKRIQQAYEDAQASAQAYLETIQRANAREVAGIGRGRRFRETQAGFGAIEDRALAERRRLEGELRRGQIDRSQFDQHLAVVKETFDKEVELYNERTRAIEAAQADWLSGANEALQNYVDETRDIAKQVEDLFGNAFKGLEDTLVDLSTNGIKSFKDLKDAATKLSTSIVADVNRILIKQNITAPLAEMIQSKLPDLGSIFGLPGARFPMDERLPPLPRFPGAGAAAGAAAGPQFQASVATAGTTFQTSVQASSASLQAAGTTAATEVSAAATTHATEVVTAATTHAAEITTAASSFAAIIEAAGARFAASVAASPMGGDGPTGEILGELIPGFNVLDFFAEGGPVSGPGSKTSDSVPAMLSNQEFVVRASKASEPGAPQFLDTFNRHGLAAALSTIERGSPNLSSGDRAPPKAGATVQAVPDRKPKVIPFARGGILTRARHMPLATGDTALAGEAGPEVILPLKSGRAGKRGVSVAGRPDLQLPLARDAAGAMAVDIPDSIAAKLAQPVVIAGASQIASRETPSAKRERSSDKVVTKWFRLESRERTREQPIMQPFSQLVDIPDRGSSPRADMTSIGASSVDQRVASATDIIRTIPDRGPTVVQITGPEARERQDSNLRTPLHRFPESAARSIPGSPSTTRLARVEPPFSALSHARVPAMTGFEPARHDASTSAGTTSRILGSEPRVYPFRHIAAGASVVGDRTVNNISSVPLVKAPSIAAGITGGDGPSAGVVAAPFVGSFEKGTVFVPQTGLALVHRGESIVPAAGDTNNMTGGDINVSITQQFGPGTDRGIIEEAAARAAAVVEERIATRQRSMSVRR